MFRSSTPFYVIVGNPAVRHELAAFHVSTCLSPFYLFLHRAIPRRIGNVYFRGSVPLARDEHILRRSLELQRFPFPLDSRQNLAFLGVEVTRNSVPHRGRNNSTSGAP